MTVSNPLISVVIPTRSRPALLLRAVRSALQQTLRDIEVIVVIDGELGTHTADALSSLVDHRVRFLALPQPAGGAEARNIGVRNSRSSWIALLDDDDEWLPTKLQVQLDAIPPSANLSSLVVTSRYIHRANGARDVLRPRRLPSASESPCEFMFDYLCYFQTSTFLCSKQLMLQCPFTKDLPFFHDIDWFLRAFRNFGAQLLVVQQPLSIYHAPQNRQAISNRVNWQAKLDWGRANRHLMTRRAYSRFIVGSCAGAAVQDRAGARAFSRLFYECAFVGSPTPQLLPLLCATFLLSPALRKKLRDIFLLRRSNLPPSPQQASAS
jgi:glycosyltransferase involved in cell wall biosynthesis